ncbi:hypothetical protein, partial [Gluconobacter oxydans]
MTYLSHNASFHSRENITPSNPGTKHLGNEIQSSAGYEKRTCVSGKTGQGKCHRPGQDGV